MDTGSPKTERYQGREAMGGFLFAQNLIFLCCV